MTFNDRVTTLTQEVLLPKVVDNVLNSNILAFRLAGNAKPARSYDIRKSIKFQNSGTASSFSGLDTFSASQLDTKVKMVFDLAKQDVAGFDHYARQVARIFEDDPVVLEDVIEQLLLRALVDHL